MCNDIVLPPQSLQRTKKPHFIFETPHTKKKIILTIAEDFLAVHISFQHTTFYCFDY